MDWTPKSLVNALQERGFTSAYIARKLGVAVSTVTRTVKGEVTGSVLVERGLRKLVIETLREESGLTGLKEASHD